MVVEKKRRYLLSARLILVELASGYGELKDLIKKRFNKDITTDDFDVRYFEGSNILRICREEDLFEVWTKVQSNSKMILWCDSLLPDFEKNCGKAEASRVGKRGRE